MRAKSINEDQNFERGLDPKKSMGIGINNFEDYMNLKFKERGLTEDDYEGWWNWNIEQRGQESTEELLEAYFTLLENAPLAYQIEWADNEMKIYFDEMDEDD